MTHFQISVVTHKKIILAASKMLAAPERHADGVLERLAFG